jgi:hypothetical protein
MKTHKIYFLFFLGLLLTTYSCDRGFEEMNKDPNNPTSVSPDFLIPGITTSAMNNMYSTFVGGDMGLAWAQQVSKVQYNDEERFYPRTSSINSFWSNMYEDVVSDADAMYKLAETNENENAMGIALVLKAYGFHVLTDCYGYIPFSEALQAEEGNITPAYDSQQDVYTGLLTMLDEAMAHLGNGGDISSISDVIYHGDVSKWKKFAASLKFRMLMRISAKVDVSAQLQTLYDSGLLFTSNDDEAKLVYTSAEPNANPLYETIVFGSRGEWKASTTLTNLMASKGDPRISIYFDAIDGTVVGKDPGYANVPNDTYNYANVSPLGEFFLQPEYPGMFLSNAELQLLIAEAALKGYLSGADADAHFQNGITASFEHCDASSLVATYLGTVGTASLQKVQEEKYVALFPQGIEVWTEWRRTGVPSLQVVNDANPSYTEALRYYYNTDEASINGSSYEAAVSAQGADLLSTPVWWIP